MAKMYFPQYAKGRDGIDVRIGETVLQHVRRAGGVEIDSECGGEGTCGRCVIRVDEGSELLTEPTDAEARLLEQDDLQPGQRLACQARVAGDARDIRVFIPNFGQYTILTDSVRTDVELAPCVSVRGGRLVYHTGEDLGPAESRVLGLAVDVGTTTLVMQAVNLETGEDVGKPLAAKNPQIAYGNDVISRIGYTMEHEDGLKELQRAVVGGINRSLKELEKQLAVDEGSITGRIYDVVAVGNSTMRTILFGQDVHDLGVIPFEPSDKQAVTVESRSLGLDVHPRGMAYGAPLIGGHAGADCVADIIATRLYESDQTGMIIDIGTNGEIVIGNAQRMMTASCAAGGAYEGYQIRCGVGAIQGAITRLTIQNGTVQYTTIGDRPPLGLCGSGVIDLLAELVRNHIVNDKARLPEDYHVTNGVSICQDDINQLIVAKAGLRADQDLLIQYFGATLDEVDKIYLAGAFGNYMNVENAMTIGLLPRAAKEKFVRFGNGALAGARDLLVSRHKRETAERLTARIRHTKPNEIEGPEFPYMIAERMYFN